MKDSQHLCGYLKGVFYMYNRYLITGATGFLGRAIVEELVRRNVRVDALVLHNDPYSTLLRERFIQSSAMYARMTRSSSSLQTLMKKPV